MAMKHRSALLLVVALAALATSPAQAAKGGNSNGNGNGHGNGNSQSENNGGGNGNGNNGNGNGNGGSNGNTNNGNGNGNGQSSAVEDPVASDAIVAVPDDQQIVQSAVRARSALPLAAITAVVVAETDGRILDVQLVTFKGIYLYGVTVLEKNGVLHKLYYNARSGVRVRTD